ncbi:hypothetical protein FBUS_11141 [Fasciolopsis buskii]|uniref:C2 domain-containing protein n=1 Tax=Fasciolopsis buskii TaxID=27845 RepID=A0A8E0S0I6_9TREM|nr:hypothetical protein FBUS_11141 [Fasciolopsis buski]
MCLHFWFMLLLLSIHVTCFTVEPNLKHRRCLAPEETPSWNRTFHFNNRSLNLTLEVTDKPSHWILNYIFGILAHERLGYQSVAFVQREWDRPEDAINRLACSDLE